MVKLGRLISDYRIRGCTQECPFFLKVSVDIRDNNDSMLDAHCNCSGMLVRHMRYKPSKFEFIKHVRSINIDRVIENEKATLIDEKKWPFCKNKYLRYAP